MSNGRAPIDRQQTRFFDVLLFAHAFFLRERLGQLIMLLDNGQALLGECFEIGILTVAYFLLEGRDSLVMALEANFSGCRPLPSSLSVRVRDRCSGTKSNDTKRVLT